MSFLPSVLSLPQNCLVKPRNKKIPVYGTNAFSQSLHEKKKYYLYFAMICSTTAASTRVLCHPSFDKRTVQTHYLSVLTQMLYSSFSCYVVHSMQSHCHVTMEGVLLVDVGVPCCIFIHVFLKFVIFFCVCWKTTVADAYFHFYGFGFCKIYFACPLDKRG